VGELIQGYAHAAEPVAPGFAVVTGPGQVAGLGSAAAAAVAVAAMPEASGSQVASAALVDQASS